MLILYEFDSYEAAFDSGVTDDFEFLFSRQHPFFEQVAEMRRVFEQDFLIELSRKLFLKPESRWRRGVNFLTDSVSPT